MKKTSRLFVHALSAVARGIFHAAAFFDHDLMEIKITLRSTRNLNRRLDQAAASGSVEELARGMRSWDLSG